MSSLRYVVKDHRATWPGVLRYKVYDTVNGTSSKTIYSRKRSAEKQCDRLNAAVLRNADLYRKAKDNG